MKVDECDVVMGTNKKESCIKHQFLLYMINL
jgi:hypothetical protein